MFSINLLNEMLGYEKWVLKETVLAVEKEIGEQSISTITFHETGVNSLFLKFQNEFGAVRRVEVIEKLTPLLFVTSYKIIDMIFEWILKSNCNKVPWTFHEKIKLYESLEKQLDLKLPLLFREEHKVTTELFQLYKNLSLYRNKIIHGNWGSIVDGNLHFTFKHKNKYFDTLSFKDVMNFAELTSLIAEILISRPEDSAEVVMTIKYLLNYLKVVRQGGSFKVFKPRRYKVIYEAYNRSNIDIKSITERLNKLSTNEATSFKLIVLSENKKWEFPWEFVRDLTFININDNYENYTL